MTGVTSKFQVQTYTGAKGVRLAADIGGDASAPSILLLHGGGQTRHSWGDAMHTLVARGYHVVNLDARGHGDSEWAPDGDYTLGTLAEDIACVTRTLSSKPALVGASMGGAAALYLVGILDNSIASALVLVDIVPMINAAGASRIRDFMHAHPDGFASLSEAMDAVVAYNPHRAGHGSSSGLMKNLRKRADGRLYWHWDPRMMSSRDDIEPPRQFSQLTLAAERVRIPTLLVRGLRSDLVTDEGVADLKSRIPSIEIFNVAGAGHMVAGDKNDAFNEGVFSFLSRRLPANS